MKQSILLLALALNVLLIVSQAQQKCRALALQGGGDRGAYEAGVIYGFTQNAKNPVDFEYDVVTGVSAGSINALGYMIYPLSQGFQLAEFLNASWMDTRQGDVFTQYPGGYAEGLLLEPSLLNNDPELNYLKSQIFAAPNQRKAVLVTTEVNTGQKVIFTEKDWKDDKDFAANVALFSSAIPFVFKYRGYGSSVFIDGGWSESIDIEDAVLRCREIANSDENIIIDVVYCVNVTKLNQDPTKMTGLDWYQRGQDIGKWRKQTFLYNFTRQSYPNVNWRYYMMPSQPLLDQKLPIDFKPENVAFSINLGISDAKVAMGLKEGEGFERFDKIARDYQNNVFYNNNPPPQ